MKLVIAQGDAYHVIKVSPEIEELLGIYLDNLIELVTLSGRLQRKNLGEAARELYSTGNALLPRARPEETEVIVGGSAVIKNWRLVGWLGELETMGSLLPPTNCGWACWWWEVPTRAPGRSPSRSDLPAPKSRSCLRAIGSPSSSTSSLKLMSLSS